MTKFVAPLRALLPILRTAGLLSAIGMCGMLSAQDSAEDSLRTLHPASGLEVSLWASEPMVNNPTSMDIDSRGRVWIAEGLNYRMKQKQFDTLKRIDGADCVKVLSDTDGDGKADKVIVFADSIFPVPMGLAVEEIRTNGKRTGTRVYLGNSPDLLVLEDTDGDDKADRRFALLTGFRGVDSDHGLHGMTFGPDGKLYFTVGDARYGADGVQAREATFDVTDKSGRRLIARNFGTTLRVNRDGTQLEVLSSGHRNNYKVAVDSFGHVFGSDNDDDGNRGSRMYWLMDGGEYGYQHPDSSRHWAEELPGIIPKLVGTGNGAPAGLIVYEGDGLPEEYFGAVFQIDSGTHQVNWHPLKRHGAGFRSDYNVLLKGDDAWFRPVDLSVGPDGSLFICDWYDAGVGANRFSDQTTGRIYRLSTAGDHSNAVDPDGTNAIEALQSPNSSTRLAGRDRLLAQGAGARSELQKLFRNGRAIDRARAIQVLYNVPDTGIEDTIAALSDSDPRMRELALQLLARDVSRESLVESDNSTTAEPRAVTFLSQILPLADDQDAGVRRALLMAVRNVPTSNVGAAIITMSASWDGRDRYYLEALRSATIRRDAAFVQHLFDDLADRAIASGWDRKPVAAPPFYPIGANDAFLRTDDQLPPSNAASRVVGIAWVLERTESLPALKRILERNESPSVEHAATIALAGIEDPAAGELLMERYLADTVDVECRRSILTRLGAGVSGPWKTLTQDARLQQVFRAALKDQALQAKAIQSIARGKLSGFGPQLMLLAEEQSGDDVVRAAAITSLGRLKHGPARELVTELVGRATGQPNGGPLALAALDALQSFADGETQEYFAGVLADSVMPLDVRRRSLQLVTGSVSGVDRVLVLRKEGTFPESLEGELSFLLHNHADYRVRQRAEKEMPIDSGSNGRKIHSVRAVLALQGDAIRGQELFRTHKDAVCARCHRVNGEGTLVGPDLASVGMKYGGKELLYHIQYPSGAINYNFVARTLVLEDGRVLSGLVVDRKDGQITLGIATGKHVTIAADEVEEELPQTVSLMPEGLVAKFTEQQLADLVEYLLTLRHGDAVRSAKTH